MDRIASQSSISAVDVSKGSATDVSKGVDAVKLRAKVKELEKENEQMRTLLVQSINFQYNFMYTPWCCLPDKKPKRDM